MTANRSRSLFSYFDNLCERVSVEQSEAIQARDAELEATDDD